MAKIGIDFGTTNSSLVAYDKESGIFEFLGAFGGTGKEKPIPSVVWYHDKDITVGKEAKENFNTFCDMPGHHIETSVKLKLGSEKKISVLGEPKEPYEIAAKILKHLKDTAEETAGKQNSRIDLRHAVFTVPINFTGKHRADLRKAAKNAGFDVNTFIHEPYAALVGYIYSGNKSLDEINNTSVLVFDWGGGTLDITAVRSYDNHLFELGTGALEGIAGDKFDEELVNLVMERTLKKYAGIIDAEDIKQAFADKKDLLLSTAEACKINLSSKPEVSFRVEYMLNESSGKTHHLIETIKRADFNACIEHHIKAAVDCINETLKAAELSHNEVAFVLMTGGSSNIPAVKDALTDIFGANVKWPKYPEFVIAQGAAVITEMNWTPYLSKGIFVKLANDSAHEVYKKFKLLVREEMPPSDLDFNCTDSRDAEARLIIEEGSSMENSELKRLKTPERKTLCTLNIPVKHEFKGYPDKVSVSFELDNDIVLHVKGRGHFANVEQAASIHNICFGMEMK